MKEGPIILCTEMVRATLEDRKIKTRRVIKHPAVPNSDIVSFQEFLDVPQPDINWEPKEGYYALLKCNANQNCATIYFKCPYGQVGDRLWVRESFLDYPVKGCLYKADYNTKRIELADDAFCVPQWKPSIFMPRWASRITLEITGIRVEKLQEITEEDALNEGIYSNSICGDFGFHWVSKHSGYETAQTAFHNLWDSLNAKHGYSWESNPWVWVISFKRL